MPTPDFPRTEFTFSFLFLKLSAKGMVAFVLAFAVAAVLLALAWRIATSDFATMQTALAKGISYVSSGSKKNRSPSPSIEGGGPPRPRIELDPKNIGQKY